MCAHCLAPTPASLLCVYSPPFAQRHQCDAAALAHTAEEEEVVVAAALVGETPPAREGGGARWAPAAATSPEAAVESLEAFELRGYLERTWPEVRARDLEVIQQANAAADARWLARRSQVRAAAATLSLPCPHHFRSAEICGQVFEPILASAAVEGHWPLTAVVASRAAAQPRSRAEWGATIRWEADVIVGAAAAPPSDDAAPAPPPNGEALHPSGRSHCRMRADTWAGGWAADPNSGAAHVVNQWIICLLFCNTST